MSSKRNGAGRRVGRWPAWAGQVLCAWTLCAWTLCAWTSAVAAQELSPRAQPSPAMNDEVARGLFQAGKAAYEAGTYQDALGFFEQAHARSGRPQLLFNIGQAADRLRQDEKALAAFRSYLEQIPNAENRVEVQARIVALEKAEADRKAAAGPAQPSAAPTPAQAAATIDTTGAHDDADLTQGDDSASTPVTKKWWFWTGIGAVVVGGTAVALAVALGGEDKQAAPFQGSAGSLKGP